MSQYPLVLSHPHIRRIKERGARSLILARRLPLGIHAVHDGLTERRNDRARRRGRVDLQEEPLALTIEIDERKEIPLLDLDLRTVLGAGFQTQRDFFDDWLARLRWIDTDLTIYIHRFHPVESPRFLHIRVHRGYTSNPGKSVRDEPEALSAGDLEVLARRAKRRQEEDEAFRERARRSIALRAKDAAIRGDLDAYRACGSELALFAGSATSTAGTAFA